jgi:1-acyl-sn-glycerol-3-phosphate acyltransferase
MADVLDHGDSLIVFPEGTRNTTEETLLRFKSGIYHLAAACPDTEFVPVWIENARRVMPKGKLLPLPLLCTLTVGAPIMLAAEEERDAFVTRTRDALLALRPPQE